MAPTGGGTATQNIAGSTTVPRQNPGQWEALRKRVYEICKSDIEARLLLRLECVMIGSREGWTADQVAEKFGIPTAAAAHYLNSYNTQGIGGLGEDPPGGEELFANVPGGTR